MRLSKERKVYLAVFGIGLTALAVDRLFLAPSDAAAAPTDPATEPPTVASSPRPASEPVALPPAALPQAPVQAPAAVAMPTVPMVPPGQVALMVSARFGHDPPPITGGLHWRIYPDKPDATGVFRLVREERAAAPILRIGIR